MIDFTIENMIKMNILPINLLILVFSNLGLGIYFKKCNWIKDKYIITLLLIFCIVFSMLLQKEASPTSFLQGILCWTVSDTAYNYYKQTKKDE